MTDIPRVFNEPNARHCGLSIEALAEQGGNSISHPIVASKHRLLETPAKTVSPALLLGAQTDSVLQTVLGLENENLEKLHKHNMIQLSGKQSD